jgi:hypothetical protein
VAVPATPAAAQTPPGPVPSGQLGGSGPCTVQALPAVNNNGPADNSNWNRGQIWIYKPSGTGSPRTGGTCTGGSRPVAILVHGWSSGTGSCSALPPGFPDPTGATNFINNLVSNGHIVIFPNYCAEIGHFFSGNVSYDQVREGVIQVANDPAVNQRMNMDDLGIWGHSYGGGMTPWLALQFDAQGWGDTALWLAPYAPYDPLRLPNPSWTSGNPPDVNLPAHTRSLHVIYQHDDICSWLVWLGVCNVGLWSLEIYQRLNLPTSQKWGVTINSDCRTPTPCSTPYAEAYRAHHFVPGGVNGDGTPVPETHLRYYGSYRNVQAVSDCARPGDAPPAGNDCDPVCDPSCTFDITYMGTWSDGVAATPATRYIP